MDDASPLARLARHGAALLAASLLAGCGSLRLPSLPLPWPSSPSSSLPPAAEVPPPTPPRAAAPPPAAPAAPRPHPPDAVPRVSSIPQGAPNVPYEIKGELYEPESDDVPMTETGIASWYGRPFHGRRTATGEVYDMHAMTAAHKTMPLPSYAVVRNPRNKREVVVRVNDRGPFKDGRIIDLSHAAARKLGISGIGKVEVRRLTHAEIRSGSWKLPTAPRVASSSVAE
ncbi:septal ring lytic transglycosylase RlpA family protein [Piscinibacter sp.]|uniref:septal ring lytic transglycosylase RlpA family protein n=1 Tax=Piscinibacter sp. TaxID=1903157 RepID=UPI0011D367D2|nr:MAG: septal ring lytic transglycosylase RlpA family protein [Burkholderiaceae bacterium]